MERRKKNDLLRRITSIVLCAFIAVAYIPTFAFAAAEEAPEVQGTASKDRTKIIVDGDDTSDPDELLMQYMHNEVKGPKGSAGGLKAQSAGYDSLDEKEAAIYDIIIEEIRRVADGDRDNALLNVPISTIIGDDLTITAEELGLSSLVDSKGNVTKEADAAVKAFIGFDAEALIPALLADCPYELYWYDKTEGCSVVYEEWYYNCSSTEYTFIQDINIYIGFTVSDDYRPARATEDTDIDTDKTKSAKTAADTARRIINDHKSNSDYEKLKAYKDDICKLTSYNDAAADPSYEGYGDPWQMIWVFDGDVNTTVVCEGYAKAFQFLCDETKFKSKDIECISATGLMTVISDEEEPGEDHMWNIVHMSDGKNYIADITNCDGDGGEDDSIGYPDKLFLTGAVAGGSVSRGYGYDCDDDSLADIMYTYDDTSNKVFGNSKLTMSEIPYQAKHSLEKIEAKDATCTEAGNIEYWRCSECEKLFSDAEGETETSIEAVTVAIDPNAHSYGDWTKVDDTYHQKVCAHNNTHVVQEQHSWNDGVITTEASCETDAIKTYTCTACGATKTEVQENTRTGHDWEFTGFSWTGNDKDGYTAAVANYKCRNDASHTQSVNAIITSETQAATCDGEGKTTYTATVDAGESLDTVKRTDTRAVTIPATGHAWGEWTVTRPETKDAVGEEKRICSKDPSHFETRPITKLRDAKEAARADLRSIRVDDYDDTDKAAIQQAINDALAAIDDAETVDAVSSAKDQAKNVVASKKTKAQKEKEAAAEAARKAEAAAEATFNGTPDGTVPKVKSPKAKAAKKGFTISWKKANKKTQKKYGAIEVQYSLNPSFPRSETTSRELGKKKKSLKIKGLAKGKTYYVRVRYFKRGGSTGKLVGAWSGTKKAKIK